MKDPFANVPEEFKDAVAASDKQAILDRIAQVALAQEELNQAQEEDQDLQSKKEEYKVASEPYREGKKVNKQKILFCRQVLADKGFI